MDPLDIAKKLESIDSAQSELLREIAIVIRDLFRKLRQVEAERDAIIETARNAGLVIDALRQKLKENGSV